MLAGCSGELGNDEPGKVEGETHATGAGLELEVQEVTLSHRLTTDQDETFFPDPGSLFLFLKVRSENTSDEIETLAHRHELRVVGGDQQYEPLKLERGFFHESPSGYRWPWNGESYQSIEDARPGVASAGILAFEIPAGTTQAELTWARAFRQDKPLYWQLALNPSEVPQFTVESIDVSGTPEYYADLDLEIRVSNSGGEGTFDRHLLVEPTGETYDVRREIGAGQTVTIRKTVAFPESTYELTETATIETQFNQFDVRFQTPTRDAETYYTGPDGLEITISDYGLTNHAARESSSSWQDIVEYTPDSGESLLLVQDTVRNNDTVSRRLPTTSEFRLQNTGGHGLETTAEYPDAWASGPSFIEPVRGEVMSQSEISPGSTLSGWALYTIPERQSLDGCYLKWERDALSSTKYAHLQARWRL